MKNLYVRIAVKRFLNLAILVDKNPGDREETCHGDLEPIGLEIGKKGYVIVFRCKKCGAIRRNKAAEDDNMELLIELSTKQY